MLEGLKILTNVSKSGSIDIVYVSLKLRWNEWNVFKEWRM